MQIIDINNKKYPRLLKQIKNPPKRLYVEGDVDLLNKNLVAIIGSRDYTEYGKEQAKRFAKGLSESGIGVVSGMAIGIDTFAHLETIKNGGKTVAVLGSGLNNIYPKQNKELFDLIIKTGGAIISEYPPDTKMQKKNFPLRNRIVSGLSLGTLVIEATYRSGTSITANYAWKQGRKVFCIPNSINSKNSCGTINLLKKGAKIITNPMEIIIELGKLSKIINKNVNELENILEVERKIENQKKIEEYEQLSIIKYDKYDDNTIKIIEIIQNNKKIEINKISDETKIPIYMVNSILSILEMDEIIEDIGGCKYKMKGI